MFPIAEQSHILEPNNMEEQMMLSPLMQVTTETKAQVHIFGSKF